MSHRSSVVALVIGASLLFGSNEHATAAQGGGAPSKGDMPATPKKLVIVGIDNGVSFTVQKNPTEIRTEKPVPWAKSATSTADQPELTFSSAQGRTMTFELVFDTSAQGTDVHSTYVAKLQELAMVMDPSGSEAKKKPTRVKLQNLGALKFEGVIKSIDTRYTSFLSNGTPVVAVCTVSLMEASKATYKH